MAYLNEISSIQVTEQQGARIQVQLGRTGGEPVVLTFNYVDEADSVAELIDGYYRLMNNTEGTIWKTSRGQSQSQSHAQSQNQLQLQHQQQMFELEHGLKQNYEHLARKSSAQQQQNTWPGVYEYSRNSRDYGSAAELIDDEGDYSVPAGTCSPS